MPCAPNRILAHGDRRQRALVTEMLKPVVADGIEHGIGRNRLPYLGRFTMDDPSRRMVLSFIRRQNILCWNRAANYDKFFSM